MTTLLCVTGNNEKFELGKSVFSKHGINLEQFVTDIDEIQGEDGEYIVIDKAKRAFEKVGKPVIVSDDSWAFIALKGFPGPYMKSVNYWFTPDNFIDLMKNANDRRIILTQRVAYYDGLEAVSFANDVVGQVALSPRGEFGPPIMKVVEMDGDNGKTISEVYDAGQQISDTRNTDITVGAWNQLAAWYREKTKI